MKNIKYPIIYKKIPTQYAFYVSSDGTLQIKQVTDIPKVIKFKNENEARKYIKNYKVQL